VQRREGASTTRTPSLARAKAFRQALEEASGKQLGKEATAMSASLRLKAICGVPVSSENQILRLTYPPHPNETAGGSGSRPKMAEYTHPRMAVTMSRAFPATPPPTPLGGVGKKSARGSRNRRRAHTEKFFIQTCEYVEPGEEEAYEL